MDISKIKFYGRLENSIKEAWKILKILKAVGVNKSSRFVIYKIIDLSHSINCRISTRWKIP